MRRNGPVCMNRHAPAGSLTATPGTAATLTPATTTGDGWCGMCAGAGTNGTNVTPTLSEHDFQIAVLDLAKHCGWRTAHFRASMNRRGRWQTAVAGDGAGFPDLVLVHADRHQVLYRELKSAKGRSTFEQIEWGRTLTAAGADWAVWRPSDWPIVVKCLSFGRAS